ncbi:histone chaperone ASF1 [Vairimorpha necatrix]|uniref:Anti-silencing function protein 1 n=1 Tax=Vairimorpha necatrix TaxID=6039 RepID=A0AAX4JAX8_9MICR
MELLTLKKIELKETIRKATDPLEFDLEMHCKEELEEGVVFTIIYTADVKNEFRDQILSETEIFPVPKGNIKFSLDADAPEIKLIPHDKLFGLTSIIIVGKYKDEQFIRIGYIVDVYYPGIANEHLLYNDDSEEEIEEDEENEEEDDNENFDDIIATDEDSEESEEGEEETVEGEIEEEETVEGETEEETEETSETSEEAEEEVKDENAPNSFSEALVEKLAETEDNPEDKVQPEEFSKINAELEKPISEDENPEDVFEFRGYKINYNYIEMNVMVPPSVHNFLIKWREDSVSESEENIEECEIEEKNAKKIKRE